MKHYFCLFLITTPALPAAPLQRDPWLWPFSKASIWNIPIGSEAQYQNEGHFKDLAPLKSDTEFHYKISKNAPERAVHSPIGWPVVDGRYGKFLRNMRIDDDIILRTQVSNNCAAFLMPDGDHLEQLEPFIRMEEGGIALGYPAPFSGLSLRGEGIIGSHWGSQLSALGGSLRHGHLTGQIPITQALKFNCQGKRYLHYDGSSPTPGFRWPALSADNYAGNAGEGGYGGANSEITMGALLAIHPKHSAASLGLITAPAKLLFASLQNHGAYIVDDAGDDSYHFSLSHEAFGEFSETFGYSFDADSTSTGPAAAWYADMMKLISHLSVVSNNRSDRIGGGGAPRAPLAPDFGPMDAMAPPAPEGVRASGSTPLTVTLEWQPVTHPPGIANYWIYRNNIFVAETFGKTGGIVSGLTPGGKHTFTVRARSRSLVLSEPSLAVTMETQKVPEGTLMEDFDAPEIKNWKFEGGAAVRSKRLELQKWDGIAIAVLLKPNLPASFTLSADLQSIGNAAGNRTFIHLDYHDFNDTLFIEIPSGEKAASLIQRRDGVETTLATGLPWNTADRFEILVSPMRVMTFTAFSAGKPTVLLDRVTLPSALHHQLAFGVLANFSNLDNLELLPTR